MAELDATPRAKVENGKSHGEGMQASAMMDLAMRVHWPILAWQTAVASALSAVGCAR
jgi:hypothetical protein